jgi:hypothetical protein
MPTRTRPAVLALVTAGTIVGLSRSAAYAAADRGELIPGVPIFKVGQRKLVVATSALETALGIDIASYLDNSNPASA